MQDNNLESKNSWSLIITIFILGLLVAWGMVRLLFVERSYKDLVYELESKSFGNRWVSAFELSKYLTGKQIPKQDIPWFIEKMQSIYKDASDSRTKNFIVVAVGSLADQQAVPLLLQGLKEEDSSVQFSSMVALGRLEPPLNIDWEQIKLHLKSSDPLLVQASIYVLDRFQVPVKKELAELLHNTNSLQEVRYAALVGLIPSKIETTLDVVQEVLALDSTNQKKYSDIQIENLKSNVLTALKKNPWKDLRLKEIITNSMQSEKNIRIMGKMKEVLAVIDGL